MHTTEYPEEYGSAVANLNRMESYKDNHTTIGCPVKAARAIFQVSKLEKPPVHLPLGKFAYWGARDKFERITKEIDELESIGLPTDM